VNSILFGSIFRQTSSHRRNRIHCEYYDSKTEEVSRRDLGLPWKMVDSYPILAGDFIIGFLYLYMLLEHSPKNYRRYAG